MGLIKVLLILLEYIAYICMYRTAFDARFRKPNCKCTLLLSFIIAIGICVSVIFNVNITIVEIILGFTIIALLDGNRKKWLSYYFIVSGGCITIESLFDLFIRNLLFANGAAITEVANRFICVTILIVLLIIAGLIKDKFIVKSQVSLNRFQILVLYGSMICCGFVIGTIELIGEKLNNVSFLLYSVSVVLMTILFYILSIYSILLRQREMESRITIQRQEEILKTQQEQIESIIENERRIYAIRHDLNAHMQAINALLRRNDLDGLRDYCEKMKCQYQLIENGSLSGNIPIDGVLHYYTELCREKNIRYDFKIVVPETKKISDYELCIIISNILKNAIQACFSGEQLSLVCQPYNANICILSKNPIHNMGDNKKSVSFVEEKIEHGHGLTNIHSVVKKYDGTMNTYIKNDFFNIEIVV